MANIEQLQALVNRFDASLAFYKDTKNAYNEHSCRIEYIDPFLKLLSQINKWRVALSNELYAKGGRYLSLEVLNDVVQEFINQIVFLRICEDKNLLISTL